MKNPMVLPPQAYELIHGYNARRRVIRHHDRRVLEAEFERLRRAGKKPGLFIGDLLLKGDP